MLARGPDGHVGFVFDLINRLANAFGYSGSTEEDTCWRPGRCTVRYWVPDFQLP
jgi:hypothetical protein